MLTEENFDLFIAYHGTNDANGSLEKAAFIYDQLKDKIKCFFNPVTNANGRFGDTPTCARNSKLFLLVANQSIPINSAGCIKSPGLYNEVDAFYANLFDDISKKGSARVYTYNGLTPKQADKLHVIFSMTNHFDESRGAEVAMSDLIKWIESSLNLQPKAAKQPQPAAKSSFETDRYKDSFTFSSEFFHKGATELKNRPFEEQVAYLSEFSKLYSQITVIENMGGVVPIEENLGEQLHRLIVSGCKSSRDNVLKIKGPVGSYKNRLLQYIYLIMAKTDDDILPVYIDIAMYEKFYNGSHNKIYKDVDELLNADFSYIERLFKSDSTRIPLLIIDGIRDFSSGKNSIYTKIDEAIKKLNCKIVIGLDTDFTTNPKNKFKVHPLAPSSFTYFVRIRSMQLYKKEASLQFIKNCIKLFDIPIVGNITPESIYERLVKLDLITIDAYWIVNLLSTLLENVMRDDICIHDLYQAVCDKALQGKATLDEVAEFAYEYEFGNLKFDESESYFRIHWKLIRKHRSILDYLIARYYVNRFKQIDIQNDSREELLNKLSFFDMILPKRISRFVMKMFGELSGYESTVLYLAKNCYDDLNLFTKSQLTFWLGRLNNSLNKEEGRSLLENLFGKEQEQYAKLKTGDNVVNIRREAFLLRGIAVSLIYCDNHQALDYYINSLLNDKVANTVNRGFHLEYYGDKLYIPKKNMLDFEDDITKGSITLDTLCLALDKRIKSLKFNQTSVLEIATLCSLIQARLEHKDTPGTLPVTPYVSRVSSYLEWALKKRAVMEYPDIWEYFNWMLATLKSSLNNGVLNDSRWDISLINDYSAAKYVARTGWVDRDIPNPENIVEHMYNCWLIGVMLLPDNEKQEKDYSKEKILKMLLIHDLAETKTGDISRPQKIMNKAFYDKQEDTVMRSIFLNGTFPDSPNLAEYYDCWDKWYKNDDINSAIAKDIDNIQAIYQMCLYYIKFGDKINADDFRDWLLPVEDIPTEIGRSIYHKIIIDNPLFKDILPAEIFEQDR